MLRHARFHSGLREVGADTIRVSQREAYGEFGEVIESRELAIGNRGTFHRKFAKGPNYENVYENGQQVAKTSIAPSLQATMRACLESPEESSIVAYELEIWSYFLSVVTNFTLAYPTQRARSNITQTTRLPPRRTGLDSRRGPLPGFSHVGNFKLVIMQDDAADRAVGDVIQDVGGNVIQDGRRDAIQDDGCVPVSPTHACPLRIYFRPLGLFRVVRKASHRKPMRMIDMITEQRRNERVGKREIPEKTHLPMTSSGTILKCENPERNGPGIESGSPW
ncbi:hypothetical protein PR048_031277 [Dryococelus australis]|uniref:Uncharacterized protein n=1 Tax=Dryococelus australis TaxID=614101 RepID=A0ABQ9G4T3_9NEOP|nr:hypothetical protein PR048_031277 [Dryococelus australis]